MPSTSELGVLVQRVAYAGLDALRAALPLDLCAYLHTTADAGPQLYMRAPDLSGLEATAAFQLFSALRDTLDHQETETATTVVSGFESFTVVTMGTRSRGLFVVGRKDDELGDQERETATILCRAVGSVSHALADAAIPNAEPEPVRVTVAIAGGQATADVLVSRHGDLRPGQATAASPTAAVALATLEALDPTLKLVHNSEGDIGDQRAVLVLVRDERGYEALGSALGGADHLQATAGAALQAGLRLLAART